MNLAETILSQAARWTRAVDLPRLREDVAAFAARHAALPRRAQAERMIERTARRAALLGVAASLPPAFGALEATGPELGTLVWLQSRMVLGLHILYGCEPEDAQWSREALAGLAAGAGIRAARELGTRAARELAGRFAEGILRRGRSSLVPVAGVAAGAFVNHAAVSALGRAVLARVERLAEEAAEAGSPRAGEAGA